MEWIRKTMSIITNESKAGPQLIDSHCHILHGMDDGPLDLFHSLDMVNHAIGEGIAHIVATPHHRTTKYENKKNEILQQVHFLNEHLKQFNIPLTIHPGQEIRIHHDLLTSLHKNELLTLNDGGKYFLIELPSNEVPDYSFEMVYELALKGYTAIIPHPERNREILQDPNLLIELIKNGARIQITASSLLGLNGRKIKHFCEKILKYNLVHLVATDAHDTVFRKFYLKETYHFIEKKFGWETSLQLKENANFILTGKDFSVSTPLPLKKKALGLF